MQSTASSDTGVPADCSWAEGQCEDKQGVAAGVNTPLLGCIGSSSVIHYSLHKTLLASGGKTTL